jgi:hypothetical protein
MQGFQKICFRGQQKSLDDFISFFLNKNVKNIEKKKIFEALGFAFFSLASFSFLI